MVLVVGVYYIKHYPSQNFYNKVVKVQPSTHAIDEPKFSYLKVLESHEEDEKFESNLVRARTNFFDLGLSNPWDWWFTCTFDKEKVKDRYDISGLVNDLSRYLRNQRRNFPDLAYLFIPERHSESQVDKELNRLGAWHIHGLLYGLPESQIEDLPPTAPYSLREKGYKHWSRLSSKFGYTSFDRIRSGEGAVRYMLKYMTKDVSRLNSEVGNHMYYHSTGLRLPDKSVILGDSPFLDSFLSVHKQFSSIGDVYCDPEQLMDLSVNEYCEFQSPFKDIPYEVCDEVLTGVFE